jgi:hypothetical protein
VHKYSMVQMTMLRCVCVCVCVVCRCVCVYVCVCVSAQIFYGADDHVSYEKSIKGDLQKRPSAEVKETFNPFKRGLD